MLESFSFPQSLEERNWEQVSLSTKVYAKPQII
jgi:hypothetical protein